MTNYSALQLRKDRNVQPLKPATRFLPSSPKQWLSRTGGEVEGGGGGGEDEELGGWHNMEADEKGFIQ